MKIQRNSLIAAAVLLTVAVAAGVTYAEEKRQSPHETTTGMVGTAKVTIEYGRPSKKGRDIFGALVPYGEVWRTGADEATTFTTDADLTVGTLKVPKGTYGLFTLPGKDKWQLIVNKTAKQWGAFKYDAKADLGRTDLKVTAAATPVEEFTIAIKPGAKGEASLELSWDKTVASVALTAGK